MKTNRFYWQEVVAAVLTIAGSGTGAGGFGLVVLSSQQTPLTSLYGGLLIGVSIVCWGLTIRLLAKVNDPLRDKHDTKQDVRYGKKP